MTTLELLEPVMMLARQAGAAIMEIYGQSDFGVQGKEDDSPLTRADIAAHHIISEGLARLTPDWPQLSEEAAEIPWSTRQGWQRYWLIDPLDGTKEFIKRNGEFTVNIALIENGVPVLGVVYAPVLDWLYAGVPGIGASKRTADGVLHLTTQQVQPGGMLRVVASRTHRGDKLDAWLAAVEPQFASVETLSMGSSLKICLVAEGSADVYPRLAPTCEWDTAAAQAVLMAAGGKVVFTTQNGSHYYNQKDSLRNPYFMAQADPGFSYPPFTF